MVGKYLKAAAVGKATLEEWLGEGGVPVPMAQAEQRASVCRECPKNWHGNWWTLITADMAASVMTQRAEKMRLKLMLSNEEKLGTCKVCLCHLPLKCLVPMQHILKHTTDEIWNQLPQHCWIKAEGSEARAQGT